MLRKWHVVVLPLMLVLGLAMPNMQVKAGDHGCKWKWVTVYETVVDYESRSVPYVKIVCEYDSCGRPVQVRETCYKTVRVPVKKTVAVVKKVPVCH